MRKFLSSFNVLVTVLVPVGFLINLCCDLAHPEWWGNWQHDPRLYGTLAIVVLPPLILIVAREQHLARRQEKRHARLNSMLKVVKELLLAGQREDGDQAYALYHRVKAARSVREEDRLAMQFADQYGARSKKGVVS